MVDYCCPHYLSSGSLVHPCRHRRVPNRCFEPLYILDEGLQGLL